MGLWQKSCETYDAMSARAGKVCAGEKEPLCPICHIMARAQIEITLNRDGEFVSARSVNREEPRIIIPVTEESAGRTSAPCAHPLCDQLDYLAPCDPQKHALYVRALMAWTKSKHTHPKLRPVLSYIRSGTILTDLSGAQIIKLDRKGRPSDGKLLVRWVVNGLGEELSGPCWEDRSLMQAFIDYSAAKRADTPPSLCMVSGTMEAAAGQHPKGTVSLNGNAKLISANDSSGFTYRGRFDNSAQAATVGYTASQKAHCALRWLIANQGTSFGGRTFVSWNPQGFQLPAMTGPLARGKSGQRAVTPAQYRQQLGEALSSWKSGLPGHAEAVIAAFDAATAGRLAVTYYNELPASDLLQRLYDWEDTCKWENGPWGVQSPPLYQLVTLAFGAPRNGRADIDSRVLAQQMQRLAACRINRTLFPLDMEQALVERASHLLLYDGENRPKLLFTACAAIRKYHCDHGKEEWDMALDQTCTDRSYLFGRLLAVAEAVERSAYTKEGREPNALRMQKAYVLRPMAGWRILEEKLEPCYQRLKPGLRQYYRGVVREIVDMLSVSDAELNRKLDDVYLLGYYHQRACRAKKSGIPEAEE